MSENAPPGSSNPQGDAERGKPYYEKLRKDLREALAQKRRIDEQLSRLDQEIYSAETRYLEETTAGNIVKGWDNFAKGASTAASTTGLSGGTSTRRKGGISESDRIFSKSSVAANVLDSPAPSSSATPSHAPTPTSASAHGRDTPGSAANKAANQKKKKAENKDEDETDTKSSKRPKISYGRE